MKILVIGGTGFIGHHLSAALVQKGHEVVVLSRSPNPVLLPNKGVEYVIGNYFDEALLRACLKDVTVAYHLVSTTTPSTSNKDPFNDVSSNVGGIIRLLELCVEAGISKVVFPSSGGTVYGVPISVPLLETHSTNPICSYGITKLASEKYLHLFYYLHKLDYTILRIANPYGPGQDPTGKVGVISHFLNRLLHSQPVTIWGDGSVVRDYIFITDVVNALCRVLDFSTEHKIFNIGSGTGSSLNELVESINDVSGFKLKVFYQKARPFDTPVSVLNIDRARTVLGWSPQVSLNEGLLKTWRWLYDTHNQ